MTCGLSLRAIAIALGGNISGRQVVCPGPGHSCRDRSISVALSDRVADGLIVNSFAGDDWVICRDYVLERLGMRRGAHQYAERLRELNKAPASAVNDGDLK